MTLIDGIFTSKLKRSISRTSWETVRIFDKHLNDLNTTNTACYL